MTGKIKNERKKKKQQNILFRILFLLALAVFLYAAVRLILYGITYWKGSHEYKGLQKYVSEQPKDEISTEENGEFTVDFSGLKELNPDCIGWIRFENINISYPIMQGEDNEYYLKHTFEGQAVTAASIFMDANNHADFSDQNTFIYGHNMKNGAMFANIKKFADHDYFINHPEVYIYLPDGSINVYSVYSTKIIDATSDYYLKDIDYASYVANAKSSAKQSRDVDTQNGAPLLLLSTCYAPDTTTRSVLFARLEKNVK